MHVSSIVVSLVFIAVSGQHESDGLWAALTKAAAGGTVVVETVAGDHIQGRIVSVDDSVIVVGDPPSRGVIPKTQVCRVTVGVDKRVGRMTLIAGLTIAGYLVGKLVGAEVTDDPYNKGGLMGAGLGAIAGSVIPLHGNRVLYAGPGC